jgi:bacillithiol biosynthesis cysteine-adding enzyme BshC
MTFRIEATPLAADLREPAERPGGLDPLLLPAFIRVSGVESRLARLSDPDVLVVTTGQQPALFTGPVYAVYKALSAAQLARLLEERWGRPVVPVFWAAGDDHDWAEASSATWLDTRGEPVTTRLRERPPSAPMLPLAREPLGQDVIGSLELARATLPESPHRESALAWLARHFTPAATVAAASNAALAELLAPFGVLCFDPTHPAAKRAAARHVVRALGLAGDLDRDLGRRAAELAMLGADPGIVVGDGATLVMLDGAGGRDRLVLDGASFSTRRGGARFGMEELQRIAADTPERLSANVLLRPAIESALLPTVAYCAGPGELRYLPLAEPVFERMRLHRPLPVPRWSGRVVEPHVDRAARKFGISTAELADPESPVIARASRERIPDEAGKILARLREELTAAYTALGEEAVRVDPTLRRPAEGSLRRSVNALERMELKLTRAARRRHAVELRQLERARATLLPGGVPQERVLCAVSFLARHGEAVFEACADQAREWYRTALEGRTVPA